MTTFSPKTAALTVLALGLLMSSAAHAAIVRSTDGAPVTTMDGNCVVSAWEGGDCEAAKLAAGESGVDETTRSNYHINAVFFDFNKSVLTDEAKKHLDHLAKWFHARMHGSHDITVAGFADRLGNAAYNEKLALKRARVVRDYLVAKGVKAKKIEVRSLGKSEPRAECADDMPRAKLIECLHEDRRVEIEFVDAK